MSAPDTTMPRIAIPEPSSDQEYKRKTLSAYLEAIQNCGGLPVVIPLDTPPGEMAEVISTCASILLPGSRADVDPEKYGERAVAACKPKDGLREAADELLLQDAFNLGKPIFGICYGVQMLNVWLNGTLVQDLTQGQAIPGPAIEHQHGDHEIEITPGCRLEQILAEALGKDHGHATAGSEQRRVRVNSSHHQAIREAGDRVRVVAVCPDDGVVEAIEAKEPRRGPQQFVIGVQWHPERSYDSSLASRLLFEAFVRASASWRLQPIQTSVVS